MIAFLYVIGKELNEPYTNCYVGVTIEPKRRWKEHSKSKFKVGQNIRQNLWNFDENFKIIWEGEVEKCYLLETSLRNKTNIGLNTAKGGHGGFTSYTKERNLKISNKLTGLHKSEEHKIEISNSKKLNKSHVADKNSKAKSWVLIDPQNNIFYLKGTLISFCEERSLIASTLVL